MPTWTCQARPSGRLRGRKGLGWEEEPLRRPAEQVQARVLLLLDAEPLGAGTLSSRGVTLCGRDPRRPRGRFLRSGFALGRVCAVGGGSERPRQGAGRLAPHPHPPGSVRSLGSSDACRTCCPLGPDATAGTSVTQAQGPRGLRAAALGGAWAAVQAASSGRRGPRGCGHHGSGAGCHAWAPCASGTRGPQMGSDGGLRECEARADGALPAPACPSCCSSPCPEPGPGPQGSRARPCWAEPGAGRRPHPMATRGLRLGRGRTLQGAATDQPPGLCPRADVPPLPGGRGAGGRQLSPTLGLPGVSFLNRTRARTQTEPAGAPRLSPGLWMRARPGWPSGAQAKGDLRAGGGCRSSSQADRAEQHRGPRPRRPGFQRRPQTRREGPSPVLSAPRLWDGACTIPVIVCPLHPTCTPEVRRQLSCTCSERSLAAAR